MKKSKFLPAFDMAQMKRRCLAKTRDYLTEPNFLHVQTKDGLYLYQDNGADVLAVAHLDTVQDTDHFWVTTLGQRRVLFNCQLDDRLGVYLLLDYLPALLGGRKYDILLTEGEEHCMSTAYWFESPKQYKWMFQFDRAGTDVVLYQYETRAVEDLLEAAGWHVGIGSYSDICELGGLKCAGINFGVGYEDNHGELSHAYLADIYLDVRRFKTFWDKHHADTLPIPSRPLSRYKYQKYQYDYQPWDYDPRGHNPISTTKVDQHGDPVLMEDLIDDDLDQSLIEQCSGCNGLFNAADMYWVGSDGYCEDCVDLVEDRKHRRGKGKYDIEFPSLPGRTCPRCFNFTNDGYCSFCDLPVA